MKGATMGTKQTQAASTPGPWCVIGDRNGWLRIGHGTNCSIANVFEPPIGGQRANATLIAAAPALYEALAGLLSIFDSVTMGQEAELRDEWIPQARAAIRQARGEA